MKDNSDEKAILTDVKTVAMMVVFARTVAIRAELDLKQFALHWARRYHPKDFYAVDGKSRHAVSLAVLT